MPFLFVMLGGAIGAGARHLVGRAMLLLLGPGLPWGTLTANLLGGLLMGLLTGVLARISLPGESWRLFLGTGVLGGFTTFSTFSLDTVFLIQRGEWIVALGYVLVSVTGAIGALFLGLWLTRVAA